MKQLLTVVCYFSLVYSCCNGVDFVPARCVYIASPIPNYSAQVTTYAASVIQCAVYCQRYQTANNFFAYGDSKCLLYQNYPGYTNQDLSMYCTLSEVLQRRYCMVTEFQGRNFTDAFNICRSNYMSLVSMETEAENSFLFAWINQVYCRSHPNCTAILWTSGFWSTDLQGWVWEGSNSPFTITKWASSNLLGTHVATAHYPNHTINKYWIALDSSTRLHFICEKEA